MTIVLSLGETPLANALLSADQLHKPERTYPLDLAFCPHCALVQITETVPPTDLFRDYVYFSSFSDAFVRHAGELSRRLIAERGLDDDSLVMEAASNDGYLLKQYRQQGIPVLGIDPASNVVEVARRENGVDTICDFFGRELARRLADEGRRAAVFHANNVLAHVPDLNGFVAGIGAVLRSDGVAVIEAPYVRDMIEKCEFDTIYHEHLCYFSLTALDHLFRRHGLLIHDVERLPIHGGSLRLFVVQAEGDREPGARVRQMLADEQRLDLDKPSAYADFAARVERLKGSLSGLLHLLKRRGKTIAAYGASAKGSTLLNYCQIGRDVLDFVVDRSSVKRGRYMPGVRLPIHAPEALMDRKPDVVLMLTWNFADEILRQQHQYRESGGSFLLPIPEPVLV